MASGLDINGYVLSYFEGSAILHCYRRSYSSSSSCNLRLWVLILAPAGIIGGGSE